MNYAPLKSTLYNDWYRLNCFCTCNEILICQQIFIKHGPKYSWEEHLCALYAWYVLIKLAWIMLLGKQFITMSIYLCTLWTFSTFFTKIVNFVIWKRACNLSHKCFDMQVIVTLFSLSVNILLLKTSLLPDSLYLGQNFVNNSLKRRPLGRLFQRLGQSVKWMKYHVGTITSLISNCMCYA